MSLSCYNTTETLHTRMRSHTHAHTHALYPSARLTQKRNYNTHLFNGFHNRFSQWSTVTNTSHTTIAHQTKPAQNNSTQRKCTVTSVPKLQYSFKADKIHIRVYGVELHHIMILKHQASVRDQV